MPKRQSRSSPDTRRADFGLTRTAEQSQAHPTDLLLPQTRLWLPLALGRLLVPLVVLLAASLSACSRQPSADLRAVYDPETGALRQLQLDGDKNGRVDTWSYMDGTRVLRIEIDRDEDGKIDRWEYYGHGGTLERVGLSRAQDGRADAWAYSGPDGSLARLEISTRRDGRVSRIEFFEAGRRVRAEEDGDGDGRVDKWETYRDGVLATLAVDTARRGTPDRLLVYAPDGTVTVQTDPSGTGRFEAAKPAGIRGPRS